MKNVLKHFVLAAAAIALASSAWSQQTTDPKYKTSNTTETKVLNRKGGTMH
jgi:hypothetical protein